MPLPTHSDIGAVARDLKMLLDRAESLATRLIRTFGWYVGDARWGAAAHYANAHSSPWLALVHFEEQMTRSQWWRENGRDSIGHDRSLALCERYLEFVKIGYIQLLMSGLEASFRDIIRVVSPGSCNNGNAEFKAVYDHLLLKRLATPRPEIIGLLDMLRTLRNTIHNNGVYFHPRGRPQTLDFRGESYAFELGKPVEFATWALLLAVSEDILAALELIVFDEAIVRHTRITDTYAAN